MFFNPNGIQMNIPAEFHKMIVFFDQDSLVTTLEQMAAPSMAAVEINRVGGIETLHEFSEVRFRGHQKEMKMLCEVPNYVKLRPPPL
jgi:hypothetical protein